MRRVVACSQILLLAAILAACSGRDGRQSEAAARAEEAANAFPANYKTDVLAMLRVYLNDPTNVREAGLTEPFLQPVGGGRNRYAVCVRLSTRKSSGEYAAAKEHVAYFLHARLDQMIEANREQCAEASYQAFPEAEKLSR
jgi:hypothetical protein